MNGKKAKLVRKRMKKEFGKDWHNKEGLRRVCRLIKHTYTRQRHA
jgi:hypothetical protein